MEDFFPPGESPLDPANKNIDPLAFALAEVGTCLIWIDEHLASFRAKRTTDSCDAENDLNYAELCTSDARTSMQRALELILSGYTIDALKIWPRGFLESFIRNRS
jgi:hypothetical protein